MCIILTYIVMKLSLPRQLESATLPCTTLMKQPKTINVICGKSPSVITDKAEIAIVSNEMVKTIQIALLVPKIFMNVLAIGLVSCEALVTL